MSWKYDKEKITYFAETDFRGQRVKFGIRAEDRARHMYIIGKTGMGKSTLLENLAIQDIQNGEGVCFIDPHGGTAEALLQYVPKERIDDVVYFAPFDMEYPLAMNVLEDIGIEKRPLIASGLMGAFKKVWVDAWSARMEYLLSNALLALLETPGSTLLGVNRMFADKDFREMIVNNVQDASVRSFWVDEFAKYTEKFATEAASAIQNKVGQFSANPLIRNIVGQEKSTFDIRWMMDNRKIFIVNLSKGRIGEGNAALLGAMLITKMYLAAMSRAEVTPGELKELPPFYLYVDEFQSFANESFADILSEARKYKLCLTIAHQYIEQMSDEVRAAVFGNVGTMITFRVGSTDAEVLEKEFAPVFVVDDFVSLGFAQIYLKLMIKGASSAPFSARTEDRPTMPEHTYLEEVTAASRRQFARPREQVNTDITEWFKPVRAGAPPSDAPRTQKFAPGSRPDRPRFEGGSSPSAGSRDAGSSQGSRPSYQSRDNDRAPQSSGGQDRSYAPRVNERPPQVGGVALRDALARVNSSAQGVVAPSSLAPSRAPENRELQQGMSQGFGQSNTAPYGNNIAQPQNFPPQAGAQYGHVPQPGVPYPGQQMHYPQQPMYQPAQYGQYPQPIMHPGYPYALPPAMPMHPMPPQAPGYPPQYYAPQQGYYPPQYPQHYAPYPQQAPYPPQGFYPTPPQAKSHQGPLAVQPQPAPRMPEPARIPVIPRPIAPQQIIAEAKAREEKKNNTARTPLKESRESSSSARPQAAPRENKVPVQAGATPKEEVKIKEQSANLVEEKIKPQLAPVRSDNKSASPEKLDALALALQKLQQKAAATSISSMAKDEPVALVATIVDEHPKIQDEVREEVQLKPAPAVSEVVPPKEVPLHELKAILSDGNVAPDVS